VDLLIKEKVYERYLEEYEAQSSENSEQNHQNTDNDVKKAAN